MSLKNVLSPFLTWKNALKEPITIKDPINDRPGAPNYRGFHKNDLNKCIGCGSCEAICENKAIDMVPVEGHEAKRGDSGLRPLLDYGRCCWCALCIDICTTGSLTLSNEYTWVTENPDDYRFIPGYDKKSWDNAELGYKRAEGFDFLEREGIHAEEIEGPERVKSFVEFVKCYTKEQAQKEADRCVECGICVATCPAHMEIPQYIKAIRDDDLDAGLQLLYNTNPMPEACGRICTRDCENVCAMGILGDPVSIRWLKRYIADQVPFEKYKEILDKEYEKNGKKIAIIGGGPAGLSAAYYLSYMGYDIKIFEKLPKLGGMLRYGIPSYRMPRDVLDKEIEFILSNNVTAQTEVEIGKDIKLKDLINDYDAVYISVGAHAASSLRAEGEELEGVYSGIDFLREFEVSGKFKIGKRVAIVGGGNTAMDTARTSRRLGAEEVTVLYRRTEKEMPADPVEVKEAKEENVKFEFLVAPKKITKNSDGSLRLHMIRMELGEPDEKGRRRPQPIEGSDFYMDFDNIISSIGQKPELSLIDEDTQVEITNWNSVIADSITYQTKNPKVFTGGDCYTGALTAISAIAAGHEAAKSIDRFLFNKK